MIKKLLEPGFKVKENIFVIQEPVYNPFGDLFGGFRSFLMIAFWLVRLFGIPGGWKELMARIETGIVIEPEAVHEVKVRAERRKGKRSAADECSKDPVIREPFYPESKRRRSEAHRDHKEEKDKRAQDLGLVFSRSAGMGIKRQKKSHGLIGIEKPEFLPWFPEFSMEPFPFRRIKRNFGIVEKTFVIFHGLPVFDHSAEPPCK